MPSDSDKWIRSIKENPAGKVVADPEGNRWQWQSDDDTSLLLRKLNNDELAIEQTDIRPTNAVGNSTAALPEPKVQPTKPSSKSRDSGGGFNPYDNVPKNRRR